MKILILSFFTAVFMISTCAGQKVESFLFGTKSIIPGDTLKLVKGSLGGKVYVNVFIDQSKLTSNTRLTEQFDGYVVIIKSLKSEKKKKQSVVTATLSGLEPFKTKCFLKEALESGELVLISKKKF